MAEREGTGTQPQGKKAGRGGLARRVTDLFRRRGKPDSAYARDAEAARLHAILASIADGVIVQDMEGRIILMNEAARRMLGSQKAFWDSDLCRLSEPYRHISWMEEEMVPLGEPTKVQVNDRILAAQAAAVALESGERIGTVIVLHDVTRDALAERLKDEFITQISHELRTPLTAIKGFSDVLLNTPPDMEINRKFLEAISRNAAVLDRMIVELLDISEIGTGSFSVRQDVLSLEFLIWDIIRGMESRIRRAELEIQLMVSRPGVYVLGDDRRLRWAIGHILDNAIKYTLPGGEIVVRIGQCKGNLALIEVSDTGIGIQPKDMPHIFERFYRGEAITPDGTILDPRGLGQGLYVARAVAEAHGGYLTAASKLGEGSTFTMAIPLAPEPVTEDVEEAAYLSDSRRDSP